MSGRSLDRRIFTLALPALGALAADPLLSLVDTAFVARLGPAALAGLSVNGAIFGFAFVVFNFLAYVTTPLVARLIGGGRNDEAVATIARALVLATVLGLAAALVLFAMARPLLALMQTSEVVLDPALSYLRVRAWAGPAVLITLAAHGAFRGLADTKTPLLIALLANGLNVGLDALLIFGFGLGIAGSALGSVIAQYIGAAILVRRLIQRTGPLPMRRVDWAGMATLLKPGGWVTMRTLMLVIALAATTATAARLGVAELGAHQVVRETWFLSAMLVDGLAIAAQTLVADARGRLDSGDETAVVRRLLLWATAIGVVFTLLWLLAPSSLAAVFAPNSDVAAQIHRAIPAVAAFAIPAAWLWVLDGVVLGQMRLTRMALSTAIGAGLSLVVLALVPGWGWGLFGVWISVGVLILGRLGVLLWGGVENAAFRLR